MGESCVVEDEDVGKGSADEVHDGPEEPEGISGCNSSQLDVGGTMLSGISSRPACICCPDLIGSCRHTLTAQVGKDDSSVR